MFGKTFRRADSRRRNSSEKRSDVPIPGKEFVRKLKGVINGSVIREKRCKTESSF